MALQFRNLISKNLIERFLFHSLRHNNIELPLFFLDITDNLDCDIYFDFEVVGSALIVSQIKISSERGFEDLDGEVEICAFELMSFIWEDLSNQIEKRG